jgi:hypothetical protein
MQCLSALTIVLASYSGSPAGAELQVGATILNRCHGRTVGTSLRLACERPVLNRVDRTSPHVGGAVRRFEEAVEGGAMVITVLF